MSTQHSVPSCLIQLLHLMPTVGLVLPQSVPTCFDLPHPDFALLVLELSARPLLACAAIAQPMLAHPLICLTDFPHF